MDKAHDVEIVSLQGTMMRLRVDGRDFEVDIAKASKRLAGATSDALSRYELSPSGYGIHWPDVDEDLSIDGLIGIKHHCPFSETKA